MANSNGDCGLPIIIPSEIITVNSHYIEYEQGIVVVAIHKYQMRPETGIIKSMHLSWTRSQSKQRGIMHPISKTPRISQITLTAPMTYAVELVIMVDNMYFA
jgi:hypothetical protein